RRGARAVRRHLARRPPRPGRLHRRRRLARGLAEMKRVADDLYLLRGFPPNVFNVYLMGGVLVDAATRHAGRRILRQLKSRTVTPHALTHAPPDHQGASHRICQALNLPLWCGEADADAVEDPRLILRRMPDRWINRTFASWWLGPPHPV